MTALGVGFATGFSLILAIGAQNAFVLRQGLMRSHVFSLCLFCAVSDALLIAAGVAGFGAITTLWPGFPGIMALAGSGFLLVYGAMRFRAAWAGGDALTLQGRAPSLKVTIATAAAFTWLNPHVYLDTLGLIGAISTQFLGSERMAFGAGAVIASFVFFFSLGYGARWLAPMLRTDRAWRVLDAGIGVVMWGLAAKLIGGLLV
ncbi:LysE/ArgO family amino acid transporter [Meridianimarinicoccus aquatilis]|uniref:Amino acid transporter n=1 Tax=Meridianimarinicoccus aquatilis TaxID=2552766 RepID=A0A4R6B0B9_9RHOB|nr:LysE/ArgO family amino acid transporter [Fluviibacterium aquatile]TDL89514.1 amino acid transporter [Fluviibacterium aquatile]